MSVKTPEEIAAEIMDREFTWVAGDVEECSVEHIRDVLAAAIRQERANWTATPGEIRADLGATFRQEAR